MQCVLMLIAVRFGAKCRVFWCKMRGKNKRFGQHFFVVADANLASFSIKEKCKNIVNGKKLRRKRRRPAALLPLLRQDIDKGKVRVQRLPRSERVARG